jgi:hypothetical protein
VYALQLPVVLLACQLLLLPPHAASVLALIKEPVSDGYSRLLSLPSS